MKKILFFLTVIILATSLVPASFDVSNHSISENYLGGDYISGWINLSLENEPADTKIIDSEENELLLLDFLNKTGFIHTCSTNECLSDYKESNMETTKQISLGAEDEVIIGFAFTGEIERIKSIEFDVSSTAGESLTNQLKIDILNDGKIDTGNNKPTTNPGSEKNFGIYDETNEMVLNPQLTPTPFCQKVELDEAPGFNLGGWIKKTKDAENNVEMSLYSKDGVKLDGCTIYSQKISDIGMEYSCSIEILVPEKDDYYVCMSKEYGVAEYVTKGYSSQLGYKNSGFNGIPSSSQENTGSYRVFAEARSFAPVGTVTIENELPSTDEFSYLAEEYIKEKYLSLNCKDNVCYVPIKLISTIPQTVTINNVKVDYDQKGFPGLSVNTIYDLEESPSKVTGEYQKISINNIFKLETKPGTRIYKLEIADEKIFSQEIEVKTASFDLSPKKTVANYPTTFSTKVTLDEQIKKYIWDFGDNETETSYSNSTSHIYGKEGFYEVSITYVLSGDTELKKTFTVEITSSKSLVEEEIKRMDENIKAIRTQINSLTDYEKQKLEEYFDFIDIEMRVKDLVEKLPRATESEDYSLLVEEILSLDVPEKIVKSPSKKVPFFPSEDLLYVDELKEITGESGGTHSEAAIRDAIIFWEKSHVNLLISTSDLKLTMSGTEELVMREFDLTISPVGSEKSYYVIFSPYDLEYHSTIELKESGDVSYVKLDGEKTTLSFSTNYELDFTDLPITIAPKISELALIEEIAPEEEKSNLGIFIVAFLALIILGVSVYLMLHKWYKTKYEKHLFKDKTNLYNVMIYVNNSKRQGMSNSEIRKNLRRSGWSLEQVSYIMKKFEGKQVGMPGLSSKISGTNSQAQEGPQGQPTQNPVNFQTQFRSQGMFKNRGYKL